MALLALLLRHPSELLGGKVGCDWRTCAHLSFCNRAHRKLAPPASGRKQPCPDRDWFQLDLLLCSSEACAHPSLEVVPHRTLFPEGTPVKDGRWALPLMHRPPAPHSWAICPPMILFSRTSGTDQNLWCLWALWTVCGIAGATPALCPNA